MLTRLIHRLAAVLAGMSVLSAVAADEHLKLPKDLPLAKDAGEGGEIYVMIHLHSGEAFPFVLDTGSSWTIFDQQLESKLGTRLSTGTIWRWGKSQDTGLYESPALYLGGARLQMTGNYVAVNDFTELAKTAQHPICGILGMDVLEHYCIQIDFAAGKLHFLDGEHADKSKWGRAIPMTNIGDGCLVIDQNLTGAKDAGSLIDTGCNYGGWLVPELYDKWTNATVTLAEGGVHAPNGILNGEKYRELGLHKLDRQTVNSGDAHMQFNGVGLRALSRYTVTFDFPNRTMYLRHPSFWSVVF
jgi:hypothetical protein